MEHSALHAIQLIGLLLAMGGPLLVLLVLRPACRALGDNPEREQFAAALEQQAARWVRFGALAAALATFANLFVDAAELEGKTIFNGVNLGLVFRLATVTTVGNLSLARIGVLGLVALTMSRPTRGRWKIVAVLMGAVVGLTTLVSHAAAQPTGRAGLIAAQVIHLLGGAVWLGILIHLLVSRRLLEATENRESLRLTAEIVRRFSPWALTAVSLLVCSGLVSLFRFVAEFGSMVTSPYGLTLLLKLALMGLVLYAGYRNYGTIRPELIELANTREQADPIRKDFKERTRPLLQTFGRMLELEVTAGLLVITVAGILGSIPPPGESGVQRLTGAQASALLSPHLPTTDLADPASFYGAPERTRADLRYAEFTHNFCGLFVCLLGVGWLGNVSRGTIGNLARRSWPIVLLILGVFIGIASDPEIWVLRRVSLWNAMADPQLFEHQFGAVMVFLLAWLGWRSYRNPADETRLGYALAGIMIFGSLLLLGHAHSNLNATQDLTNLINVQHAIFGTFGLLAGMIRWLSLRQLVPGRWAGWIWPSLVICLGLFMSFYYREVV